jgi:hypothetical protein
VLRGFVDGVMQWQASMTADFSATCPVAVGGNYVGSSFFNGYIDEMRITNGHGRYVGNFTPPVSQFYDQGADDLDPFLDLVSTAMHMEGANGGVTFTDVHGLVWAPTACTTSTSNFKFGTSSALLNGTTSNLNIATTPGPLVFNTQDFCIEAWIYPTNVGNSPNVFSQRAASGGPTFRISTLGKLTFFYGNGTSTFSGATTIATGAWAHVAVTRSGNIFRLFVNGVLDASATITANISTSAATNTSIGMAANSAEFFAGNIDDFRITKDAPRYTVGFTPPLHTFADAANDPYFNEVSALLHFEGADSSTTFTDVKTKVWTAIPNAQIKTAQFKFGASSYNPAGAGTASVTGGINTPHIAAFDFAANDFTIEWFQYWNSLPGFGNAIDIGHLSAAGLLIQTGSGNGKYTVYISGASAGAESTAPSLNTWYHYMLAKSNGVYTIYRNGVATGTFSNGTSLSGGVLNIGFGASADGSRGVSSYLDDLRITKGVARQRGAFSPPIASFPNVST